MSVNKSKLDKETQWFLKLISSEKLFNYALEQMDLDPTYGKLVKEKITNGLEILGKIEHEILNPPISSKLLSPAISKIQNICNLKVLDGNLNDSKFKLDYNNFRKEMDVILEETKNIEIRPLKELSEDFYNIIQHKSKKSPITTLKQVKGKIEMLNSLLDIEFSQTNLKKPGEETDKGFIYDINLLKEDNPMFKFIKQYAINTTTKKLEIVNIWETIRMSNDDNKNLGENITNRKLLWHGTNFSSVYKILQKGLKRISNQEEEEKRRGHPRLYGHGIYFASVFDKSLKYVKFNNSGYGVIFLNEVLLGKEQVLLEQTVDIDQKKKYESMTKPGGEFNSVVAKGRFEPDPKDKEHIFLDIDPIIVPIGKTVKVRDSEFYHSEYVIYDESQCRIRYLLLFKF